MSRANFSVAEGLKVPSVGFADSSPSGGASISILRSSPVG